MKSREQMLLEHISLQDSAREYTLSKLNSPLNQLKQVNSRRLEMQYHADIENAFIEGAKWEKQQMIERAWKYIKKNVCEHISHNPLYKDYKHEEEIGFQLVVDEQFYIDFKKAMEI